VSDSDSLLIELDDFVRDVEKAEEVKYVPPPTNILNDEQMNLKKHHYFLPILGTTNEKLLDEILSKVKKNDVGMYTCPKCGYVSINFLFL